MKSWEQDLQSDLRCLGSWSLTVAARREWREGGKRRQKEFAHTCCKCSVAALELDAISEPWQDAPKEPHTAATRRRVCLSLSKLKCLNCIQFAAHLPHHSIFALIVQHFPSPSMRNIVLPMRSQAHFRRALFAHSAAPLDSFLATLDQHLFPLTIYSL